MYDKDDPAEVKAAMLAAMRASIAWHKATGSAGPHLPARSGFLASAEETDWGHAVATLASVGNEDVNKVEENIRGNFTFYHVTVDRLHRDMERACPHHQVVTMFCAGVFGELHLPFIDYMGMSHQEFLDFVLALHKERRPDCPGFTATEAALSDTCVGLLRLDEVQQWS
ncbi:MAG TPA: hypothetical protein VJM32_06360 [Candidatus Saccharimonadales bacterium]|nr:hypothetical protein [Candidatus Saccharimonadales bacterium]